MRSGLVPIGQTIVEIWPIFDFQDGGRPPSWIFEKYEILTADAVWRPNMRHRAKCGADGSNRSGNMANF